MNRSYSYKKSNKKIWTEIRTRLTNFHFQVTNNYKTSYPRFHVSQQTNVSSDDIITLFFFNDSSLKRIKQASSYETLESNIYPYRTDLIFIAKYSLYKCV